MLFSLFCLNQGRNVKGLYTYLKDFAANLAPYFGADYHTISGAFWSGAITLYDLASVRDVNDYDSSSLADFAKAYEGGICPKCGGSIVAKKSKSNRKFFGCSNYPNCDFVTWSEPTKELCPKCGKTLFKKKGRHAGLYCLTEGCGYEKEPDAKEGKEEKAKENQE